jgi:hypothetical protein
MLLVIRHVSFFVFSMIFFGICVAQLIKVGILAWRRGESGWQAARREAFSSHIAIGVCFGLSSLAKSLIH